MQPLFLKQSRTVRQNGAAMENQEREKEHSQKDYQKYFNIGLTAFGVIAASMLLFFCLFRLDAIFGVLKRLTVILMPFIYGIVIAYLLNPVYCWLYDGISRGLARPLNKYPNFRENASKILSSLISVLLIIAVIYTLLALLLPELYSSVMNFANNFSSNLSVAEEWIRKILDEYPDLETTVLSYYDKFSEVASDWVLDKLLPSANTMFNVVYNSLGSMFSLVYNLVIGVIVAVYLLNGKEVLLPQCRKVIYALLRHDHADALFKELTYADQMFSGFVFGTIIDALVVGTVYFIVGTVLKLPYTAMISVIVGVTNVIPFFGPYIGAVPSAIILLLTNPMACLKFVIVIVIIQQIDGNFINPKILGNTTGLSSYWVLFSILLFGGWLGPVGMLIGVPLFAVIYHIVKSRVEYLLARKGMPVESAAYAKPRKRKSREKKFFGKHKDQEANEDEQD